MKFNQIVLQQLHQYQLVKNHQLHQIYHPHSSSTNVHQQTHSSKTPSTHNYQPAYQNIYDQQYSIALQAKQYINLKQKKANELKSHSIFERSKRVEASLSRWNQKVTKKRSESMNKNDQQQKMLNISNKNILKSQSSVRKLKHPDIHSDDIKLTSEQREIIQPESKHIIRKYQSINYRKLKNKTINLLKSQSIEQVDLEEQGPAMDSLGEGPSEMLSHKNNRINEARYMKHYIQQQKLKQFLSKETSFKLLQTKNLDEIKSHMKYLHKTIDDKHKTIDDKHNKHQNNRSKKKLSLPTIKTSLFKTKVNSVDYFMMNGNEKVEQKGEIAVKRTIRHKDKSMFQVLKEQSNMYD